MTNEEALEQKKEWHAMMTCDPTNKNPLHLRYVETVEMAIKALDSYDKIIEQIKDEAEYAYADFDRYKEDILYAEPDELPDDDFRYGLRRAIEIIDKYKAESEDKE